ncbi:MarR family winged helix-turn-helix transcriptional regulator [Jeotgalibacillus terrae]|uniref:MarR family winged helix-turn-helix transcriptional regulator n=1 Tax=Jeotgalibacillus terrae TaxID=587735 RepID=A0ABW5ZGE8_9BACL|nr:MarR family transcriptional regulator [Jeotgalibacillus terrae]MBM7579326.1 DNA-binding MarR family transcriptional regulator [Jeotgalibacillus terrae]
MNDKQYFLNDSLGYKLFHASRLMNSRLNRNFKENGFNLSYEQWQILSRLYERDAQTQNDLAVQNERDQASVSRLIDNLIKRGYVKREVDQKDRRVNKILLTDEAKRIRNDLEHLAQKTIAQASKDLSEEELALTLDALDKIRGNFE